MLNCLCALLFVIDSAVQFLWKVVLFWRLTQCFECFLVLSAALCGRRTGFGFVWLNTISYRAAMLLLGGPEERKTV